MGDQYITLATYERLYNPCDFQEGKGCAGYRAGELGVSKEIGCCIKGCKALKANGCNTTNLACKSYLCNTALDNLPPFARQEYIKTSLAIAEDFEGKSGYRNAMGV